MTNQKVINFLNQVRKILLDDKSWLESTTQRINEAFDMAISALQAQDVHDTNVGDTISRRAAIDAFEDTTYTKNEIRRRIAELPPAQPEQRWTPFALRPATDKEKEENPDLNYYLDGKLPKDGQKILITVRLPGHEEVQVDEFYSDADGSYLDGQYEIGTEAVAWMPLPEPYKEGDE